MPAYDNVGFGLIGLVLQSASGQPLGELYRKYIFEPLQFNAVAYPKPASGQQPANCYVVLGPGNIRRCELIHYRDAIRGAGGVLISGADMGKFMLALLGQWPDRNAGSGRGMLSASGLSKLLDFDHCRFHPGLPGIGWSFFEFGALPEPAFGHGGSVSGFSSILKIYPRARVGVFVSYLGGQVSTFDATVFNIIRHFDELNLAPPVRAAMNEIGGLPDRLYEGLFGARQMQTSGWQPHIEETGSRDANEPGPAQLAGRYLPLEQSRQLINRLMRAFSPVMVEPAGDDSVNLNGMLVYQRIAPFLYQSDSGNRIAFNRLDGQLYMALGMSVAGFGKARWYSYPRWAIVMVLAGCLLMVTALPYLGTWSGRPLRRFAGMVCGGAALCLGALVVEAELGSRLVLMDGAWFLPNLWRLAFHVGLAMLIIAAIRLGRAGAAGGFAIRWHLRILALAGLLVVFASPFWGLVGNFVLA